MLLCAAAFGGLDRSWDCATSRSLEDECQPLSLNAIDSLPALRADVESWMSSEGGLCGGLSSIGSGGDVGEDERELLREEEESVPSKGQLCVDLSSFGSSGDVGEDERELFLEEFHA